MNNPKAYRRARRRVNQKIGFIIHLAAYLFVITLLLFINLFTWDGYPWFLWPFTTWGLLVTAHGLITFALTSGGIREWKRRSIEDELSRDAG